MFKSWNKKRAIAVAQEQADAAEVAFVVYQERLGDKGWSEFRTERKSTYDSELSSLCTRIVVTCIPTLPAGKEGE